ncbi:MAG: electron transport complex subunit RsxA [Oscillospiraceae bacterium]|nr:electron transport complex subunit RsxA [Oscillospiraceae bacterium]
MNELLMIMLAAVLTENIIFTKLLGVYPFLAVSEKPTAVLGVSVSLIFTMTFSSAAAWLVYNYILVPFELEYLKITVFILIIAFVVWFIELVIKTYSEELHQKLGVFLPLITANCAVMGALLISTGREYDFITAVVYGVFSAAGFILAAVILTAVRERIKFSDPPEFFKGIPVTLVAAGLLVMAFSGFLGIEII